MSILPQCTRHKLRALAAPLMLLSCASAAWAQESELSRCLPLTDIQERVSCYDAIARAQAATTPDDATPGSKATSAPPPLPQPEAAHSNEPRANFGLSAAQREERLPTEERQLQQLDVVITAARMVGAGYWELTLQDGSVWRMAQVRRSFRPPDAGDTVTLRRGSLGSYFLQAGDQAGIRIKRVS